MSLSERPLLYDIMGGSLKFRLAMLVAVLCHFPVRISLRLFLNCWVTLCNEGQDSPFCVVFVEESPCTSFKFHTSRYVSNSLMLSSNIPFEEFVLRSLSASPLTKPFFTPTGWHVVKNSVVLECFCWSYKWLLILRTDSLLNLSPL